MTTSPWQGIFPALTTPFQPDFSLDEETLVKQIQFQIHAGVHGLVMVGTLGENGSLSLDEKLRVVELAVQTADGKIPVLAGVAETTTRGACLFAEQVARRGASGLMLLPAMQYVSDRRETLTHYRTVARATDLPIMIYNNPVSYGVDITPDMLAELAEMPQFVAVKESSADVRRITDIYTTVGDRFQLFIGVDDLALEAFAAGAVGWVAGLVCAFPRETIRLWEFCRNGQWEQARRLYRWFAPLLHLDASTRLVQNIKLVESLVGVGTETVRPPRLPLEGAEREQVIQLVTRALQNRPNLD
ncbi:MAG: dihydrodipicolinate synthase family protein [Calditrichaeota bacterium]|nr:MAG: dihydrodipicolinate synthase family protein [Calditrichota bacterium]